jgi:hypothetical protein
MQQDAQVQYYIKKGVLKCYISEGCKARYHVYN